MNTTEFRRIRQAAKQITEADQPTFSAAPKPPKPAKIDKPDPMKDVAPSKPAPAQKDPPPPVPPSDEKLDAVKKLNKMAEKVFKALDDMSVFANQNGLKDIAAMIGTAEDAYWEMKKNLAKIRESAERPAPIVEALSSYHEWDKVKGGKADFHLKHDVIAAVERKWGSKLKEMPEDNIANVVHNWINILTGFQDKNPGKDIEDDRNLSATAQEAFAYLMKHHQGVTV